MALLNRIKRKIDENGLKYYLFRPHKIIKFILLKLYQHLHYHKEEMYVLYMELRPRSVKDIGNIYVIDKFEPLQEFIHLREIEDSSLSNRNYAEEVRKRFAENYICVVYEKDDQVVSVIFLSNYKVHQETINYTFKIPDNTISLHDAYTLNKYRNQGIYSLIFVELINICVKKGYETICGAFLPQNIGSISLHNRLGMKKINEKVVWHHCLGFSWYEVKNVDMDSADLLK